MSVKYCFFCNRELPELASKFFHSEVPQGYAGGTQQLLTKSFHYYRCENCKVTFRYLKTTHLHTLFLTFEDKLTLPKNVTYTENYRTEYLGSSVKKLLEVEE